MKKTILLLLLLSRFPYVFTQGYVVTENVKIDSILQTSCHSCIIFGSLKGASNALIYVGTDTIELDVNNTYKMTLQWYPIWMEKLSIHFDSCFFWNYRDKYVPFTTISINKEENNKSIIISDD